MRSQTLWALTAAALLTCSACTGPNSGEPEMGAPTPPPITWGECLDDLAKSGLECATMDVPLNYQEPEGRTIEIAVSRLASSDPQKRRGVLLTNSGGPGGEGLSYPAVLKQLGLPQSVLDTYDVIGIDPRGVGRSTPVTCDLEAADGYLSNIPPYAAADADVAAAAKVAETVAQKCGQSASADVLPYITTANTARDLDQVRQALGEEKASYFGISYGTYLGSVYTSLFPESTDRVMLDSATGPGGWDQEFSRLFGEGFQDRFPDFAKYVAAHPELGLGSTLERVEKKYFELAEKLDRRPTDEGVTGVLFRQITFSNLYFDTKLELLASIWQSLDQGEPMGEEATGDAPTPAASDAPADNYLASQLHVICNDSNWPEDVAVYQRNVQADREGYPMFGAAGANITPCAYWPSEPVEEPVQINAEGPDNVLILQNLRDPATPLSGAQKLQEAFGDRARMVTADQGGHVSYLLLGDACADTAVTQFLVSGERPKQDKAC
ncbi:alpha/beta hydrolase [Kineosporia babensis]|uniref:Alpha/beta hydrolase n=1 Tax=Kineosporia babensis TaxID=499548 RepID=A0A9X1SSG2_9ACTN|nr:alpha/beta hydrolase [Kineosporia babensis]MCD5310632.1 alpha/beta hydrolase [Kineosporia babensis]